MRLREHTDVTSTSDFELILAQLPTVYVRLDVELLLTELTVWFGQDRHGHACTSDLDNILATHCFVCDTTLAVPQFEAALALLLKPPPVGGVSMLSRGADDAVLSCREEKDIGAAFEAMLTAACRGQRDCVWVRKFLPGSRLGRQCRLDTERARSHCGIYVD